MKRQTLIALGVAIILGLVAVLLVNTYLVSRERQLAASPEGMVRIAVAAMPLEYGATLTPEMVKFVNYPEASLPPGAFRSLPELLPAGKQRVALRPILVNQPLLAADLSGEGQNASIAALLPDGMRAATVRINDISGVAGFVKPNDTVDVLITRQPIAANGAGGAQVTDVLLQNIRVIAMDQTAQNNSGAAVVSSAATLEVTPVDAQKLALGQNLGALSLVLRKPGEEQNIPQLETVSLQDLRYEYASGMRAPPGTAGAVTSRPAVAPLSDAERRARLARLSQARRQVARPQPVAPPRPPSPKVDVTRGTTTSTYEVGTYGR